MKKSVCLFSAIALGVLLPQGHSYAFLIRYCIMLILFCSLLDLEVDAKSALNPRLGIIVAMMMAIGGILGVLGVNLPAVEAAIALSALALGLLVALAVKAPKPAAIALVSVFAVFHGHAHGTELPHAATPLAYGLGFVLSTGLLHASGIAIGLLETIKPMGAAIVRGCGAIIACVGLYYVLRALGVL